jgi:hypothetical protein
VTGTFTEPLADISVVILLGRSSHLRLYMAHQVSLQDFIVGPATPSRESRQLGDAMKAPKSSTAAGG